MHAHFYYIHRLDYCQTHQRSATIIGKHQEKREKINIIDLSCPITYFNRDLSCNPVVHALIHSWQHVSVHDTMVINVHHLPCGVIAQSQLFELPRCVQDKSMINDK